MKTNTCDPNGLEGAKPYKPVDGGGAGQGAGGTETYGTWGSSETPAPALDIINRSTGKSIVGGNNPPYNGGNY